MIPIVPIDFPMIVSIAPMVCLGQTIEFIKNIVQVIIPLMG